ncbi:MAG: DUF4160 domain-containing protein [Saprospiraceae bacterium]|nr:DUF4160 domain-containing protein [Saprospiraceae bacterium]
MPVIHLIDSIRILIYFDDHLPPHFHAQYNEFEILIEIDSLETYSGYLPTKQSKRVFAWAKENQNFLREKWTEFYDI